MSRCRETIGSIHLRARDLNGTLSQFSSRDPLIGVVGEPVLSSPYHYGNNDPLGHMDPDGLRPRDAGWLAQDLSVPAADEVTTQRQELFGPVGDRRIGVARVDPRAAQRLGVEFAKEPLRVGFAYERAGELLAGRIGEPGAVAVAALLR